MRALWTGLLAATLLAAAGCGGSGGKDGCGDIADKMVACAASYDVTLDRAELVAGCEAVTCPTAADKQDAIDCIMALECTPEMESASWACVDASGCDAPKL